MIRPGNPAPELPSQQQENGQPRPEVEKAPRQPSAAERARTLVEGNPSLALAIPALRPAPPEPMVPLRRSVGPEGDVFLLFPRDSAAVRAVRHATDDEVPAVLEVTDVAPVAVPHRIRGRAWVAGWLTHVPGGGFESDAELLRLEPGEISLDDLWGTALVEPDEFAAAAPDPLAPFETEVLQHLAAAHPEEVALLCGMPAGSCGGSAPTAVIPLALDRFGLRVRCSGPAGTYDARFDFPAPVDGPAAGRRALRHLFASART
ncbi:hypothetical protein SAMN05216223_109127 [Actinacidiphila yanglinensis]|uniref:DUF2470 domain-containing protein n=1 Tax=Actinacidiphila yanglinensis TaxID=310779 RepID=A0A1H6CLK3_9ACTN|nr:DUF2470 domain-containing protein [Actinacidiphila yanglinensis]SEG73545.1 hypothetical protein SAMN05216223_109127 [Actinacidiphila yanglinensis]